MSDTSLTNTIRAAMKAAMRAKDKPRLQAIRLILAEFKRIEVDERIEVDDQRALAVLDKMVKQRRDSAQQYNDAGRDDLATQEDFEISIIQEYLPEQLDESEINSLIDAAIAGSDASGMQAMGPVMGQLKPQLQGKADMGKVSALVKQRLTS
jgi:uncharacterized protein YqeY